MIRFVIMTLICAASDPVCSPDTALSVTQGPVNVGAPMCGLFGQAMLATGAIAPRPGQERMRIICSPWPRVRHRNWAWNGAILTEARLAR